MVSAGQAQRKNISEENSLSSVNEGPLSCGRNTTLWCFSHSGAYSVSPTRWALAPADEPGFPTVVYRSGNQRCGAVITLLRDTRTQLAREEPEPRRPASTAARAAAFPPPTVPATATARAPSASRPRAPRRWSTQPRAAGGLGAGPRTPGADSAGAARAPTAPRPPAPRRSAAQPRAGDARGEWAGLGGIGAPETPGLRASLLPWRGFWGRPLLTEVLAGYSQEGARLGLEVRWRGGGAQIHPPLSLLNGGSAQWRMRRWLVERAAGTPLALDKAHRSDSGLESAPSVIKILRNLNLVLHRSEFCFSPQHLPGTSVDPESPPGQSLAECSGASLLARLFSHLWDVSLKRPFSPGWRALNKSIEKDYVSYD